MGNAPPPEWGQCSSIEPRAFGGNIGNKHFQVGSTVYLPVFAEGGLFSTGDGHGVQGDGEVNLTALETSLSGTFRFTVRKDMKLNNPRCETATHWITHGFDHDLDDAAKEALRDMIRLISAKTGLSAADAYMLCSLQADLHVTRSRRRPQGHPLHDRAEGDRRVMHDLVGAWQLMSWSFEYEDGRPSEGFLGPRGTWPAALHAGRSRSARP